MNETAKVIVFTTLAGATIPLGAMLACVPSLAPDWLERELRHGVLAFGGGALLAAVALVLVPEGVSDLPVAVSTAALLGGGLVFMAMDMVLHRVETDASNLAALLADFIPEALALGAMCATGADRTGMLLAVLIGLQNLPEGFNVYRELLGGQLARGKVILIMIVLVPLGPIAGLSGLHWLVDYPAVVGWIMLFASGGILYLMFQDIAPQSKLRCRWAPALGAVLGFALGMVGHLVIQ